MSSDNTIAILMTTDKHKQCKTFHEVIYNIPSGVIAFRVAHIQACDNYDWYKENEVHNLGLWFSQNFGTSKVHYTKEDALKESIELHNQIGYVEYGIRILDASGFNFPVCI